MAHPLGFPNQLDQLAIGEASVTCPEIFGPAQARMTNGRNESIGGVMKISGWTRLWMVAVPLFTACTPANREGNFAYGCYMGPLAGRTVEVRWSENGYRADTTIEGRSYVFRFDSADWMTDTFKDQSGALLAIGPELRFTSAPGAEHSVCNPGSKFFR